jgi:lysozyme
MILEQLKRDEGFRGEPYKCTEGYWTIGYGRNLETNPLTEDEAEILLKNDVNYTLARLIAVDLLPSITLDELTPRQAVWVNMAFQMGVSGVLRFKKAIRAYLDEDYRTCAEEMLDSRWSMQTPNRAHRLADQMISGEWQ